MEGDRVQIGHLGQDDPELPEKVLLVSVSFSVWQAGKLLFSSSYFFYISISLQTSQAEEEVFQMELGSGGETRGSESIFHR